MDRKKEIKIIIDRILNDIKYDLRSNSTHTLKDSIDISKSLIKNSILLKIYLDELESL